MNNEQQQPVLIIGAGPVGILNALGLARAGVPVAVFERAAEVVQSPRAMVYHWSVLDGLERLGLFEDATARGFLKQDYTYKVHKTGEEIHYGLKSLEGHVKHPYNLHLGQNVLVEIALEHLSRYPNAEVFWNHKFVGLEQDADSVTASFETAKGTVTASGSWLIGADGARSRVRQSQGIDFDGITWPERFVATNIRYPFEAAGYSQTTMLIDDQYGAIITKIDNSGETGLWRYTYCEDASLPEEQVAERMPGFFASIVKDPENVVVEAFSPYSMHQRAATSFRSGRVLLAGDAAHATNPTGGLGLTSGLFDTYVLAEALAAVIRGEADDAVLDEYARERRRVFTEIVNPTASNNKRMVYHSSDPERLEEDLAALRRLRTDEEAVVKRLLFPKSLETPSLIGAW
ncbi:NAD(P)/FAD-dependent oxidoreductase [Arthrobacter sp. Marseille-P9274]|uniref:FAD-dependent oxidoreductase n=1 Tax=Arthrobacter sp. Marseille-P9274 TaxID=2866572 RepID=UPI0021C6C3DA|nr:NAD(P)/FAD-dependent oxidoreductase [Arthrobacter sp. Marseille-P9274]